MRRLKQIAVVLFAMCHKVSASANEVALHYAKNVDFGLGTATGPTALLPAARLMVGRAQLSFVSSTGAQQSTCATLINASLHIQLLAWTRSPEYQVSATYTQSPRRADGTSTTWESASNASENWLNIGNFLNDNRTGSLLPGAIDVQWFCDDPDVDDMSAASLVLGVNASGWAPSVFFLEAFVNPVATGLNGTFYTTRSTLDEKNLEVARQPFLHVSQGGGFYGFAASNGSLCAGPLQVVTDDNENDYYAFDASKATCNDEGMESSLALRDLKVQFEETDADAAKLWYVAATSDGEELVEAVSYTHLTLPTSIQV